MGFQITNHKYYNLQLLHLSLQPHFPVFFRVRLSKRRKIGGVEVPKSRLVVKHRDLNTKEIQAQVRKKYFIRFSK